MQLFCPNELLPSGPQPQTRCSNGQLHPPPKFSKTCLVLRTNCNNFVTVQQVTIIIPPPPRDNISWLRPWPPMKWFVWYFLRFNKVSLIIGAFFYELFCSLQENLLRFWKRIGCSEPLSWRNCQLSQSGRSTQTRNLGILNDCWETVTYEANSDGLSAYTKHSPRTQPKR